MQADPGRTLETLHASGGGTPIPIPLIGLELRVRIHAADTGGSLAVIETTNAPGSGPPLHRHRETEAFYVLEGRYLFEIDGRRFEAMTGDVVVAPGGTAHAFVNIGVTPARQLVHIMPGFDAAAFFTGLAEVMRNGSPSRQALAAFGDRWHVEFLGPPLKSTG